MKIIITIEVPNGTDVSFADSESALADHAASGDPSQPAPMQFAPQQIVAPQAIPPKQVCPTHGVSRLVPSGITKQGPRAGQIYPAFWACDTAKGVCSWKA
jgi:hypothetical protein